MSRLVTWLTIVLHVTEVDETELNLTLCRIQWVLLQSCLLNQVQLNEFNDDNFVKELIQTIEQNNNASTVAYLGFFF